MERRALNTLLNSTRSSPPSASRDATIPREAKLTWRTSPPLSTWVERATLQPAICSSDKLQRGPGWDASSTCWTPTPCFKHFWKSRHAMKYCVTPTLMGAQRPLLSMCESLCLCLSAERRLSHAWTLYSHTLESLLHACGDSHEVNHCSLMILVSLFVVKDSLCPFGSFVAAPRPLLVPAICLAVSPELWCTSLPARLPLPVGAFQLLDAPCPPTVPIPSKRRRLSVRCVLLLCGEVIDRAWASLSPLVQPPCHRAGVPLSSPYVRRCAPVVHGDDTTS